MSFLKTILLACTLCLFAFPAASQQEYYGDKPPFRAEVLPGYEEQAVKARLATTPMQPIEGIWYYPDESMTVVVERFESPQFSQKINYRVVLLGAEDMSLLPGTVIGYCYRSAQDDKYRLWIYSESDGNHLENPQKCVATLNADATALTFSRSHWDVRVRVNFARFLPGLFRGVSVIPEKREEPLPEGFRKIFPSYDNTENEVRYL